MEVAMKKHYGCSDHNCVFGHASGMGTNAGCRCLSRLDPSDKRRVHGGITALRKEVTYVKMLVRHAVIKNHEPSKACALCIDIEDIKNGEDI
jgi:hypothetical protein